jgi:hypothetical protein
VGGDVRIIKHCKLNVVNMDMGPNGWSCFMIIHPIWELFICDNLHTIVAKNNLKKDWNFWAKIWDKKGGMLRNCIKKKTWNSSKFQDKKHCCRMHFDDVQVSYPPMWLVLF